MPYLAYDIRGIQQFIHSIPKLKFIIGSSSLLDHFDRETVGRVVKDSEGEIVFSGGGKGVIQLPDAGKSASAHEKMLAAAHSLGIDLRLGSGDDIQTAALACENELFPYVPGSLKGEPCAISGMWPVVEDNSGPAWLRNAHPTVKRRYEEYKTDSLGTRLLDALRKVPQWPTSMNNCVFMKNVSPDKGGGNDAEENVHAEAAEENLGFRNRWAVVAMDGNDIGRQQKEIDEIRDAEKKAETLGKMSRGLHDCTEKAFLAGMAAAVTEWAKNCEDPGKMPNGDVVLPFRPLILGGDDILVLCHVEHAFTFVEEVVKTFEKESMETPELWGATGGRLTISAGVLFCGVTLPLHSAIPYAECLLGSAKNTFRKTGDKEPSPASIDWESIVDSLLDTPAARRQRELRFHDADIDQTVVLTRRPYRLCGGEKRTIFEVENFKDLTGLAESLESIPVSIRAELLRKLRAPWAERCHYVGSLNRNLKLNDRQLSELLSEYEPATPGALWRVMDSKRDTALLDAALILEETRRMRQKTV